MQRCRARDRAAGSSPKGGRVVRSEVRRLNRHRTAILHSSWWDRRGLGRRVRRCRSVLPQPLRATARARASQHRHVPPRPPATTTAQIAPKAALTDRQHETCKPHGAIFEHSLRHGSKTTDEKTIPNYFTSRAGSTRGGTGKECRQRTTDGPQPEACRKCMGGVGVSRRDELRGAATSGLHPVEQADDQVVLQVCPRSQSRPGGHNQEDDWIRATNLGLGRCRRAYDHFGELMITAVS